MWHIILITRRSAVQIRPPQPSLIFLHLLQRKLFMSFDLSKILIVLLLFLIVLLALKLFKKQKIKQTRYKSDSGDTVKSRAELIVANWLFYRGIDFIYEKKTPTKERMISDFYLTQSDVYIEF